MWRTLMIIRRRGRTFVMAAITSELPTTRKLPTQSKGISRQDVQQTNPNNQIAVPSCSRLFFGENSFVGCAGNPSAIRRHRS